MRYSPGSNGLVDTQAALLFTGWWKGKETKRNEAKRNERKGTERKGKERNGKERKGQERKNKVCTAGRHHKAPVPRSSSGS